MVRSSNVCMLIATWNLNNRIGKVRFRPDAATAAVALGADVIFFTEYYPKDHDVRFREILAASGLTHQLVSADSGETANRILVASRILLRLGTIKLPEFDRQFPPNLLPVTFPIEGINVLGIRVPVYEGNQRSFTKEAWTWLENTAAHMGDPSIILGDFNVTVASNSANAGAHFRRILQSGWIRATPAGGASYYGHSGRRSEIDHILGSRSCIFSDARYVAEIDGHFLAGRPSAISDHAPVVARVTIQKSTPT